LPGNVVFLAIVIAVAVLAVATMFAFVWFANRAIGRHYDELASRIAPFIDVEGVVYAEDDVRTRSTWLAPLAVGVQWGRAHVRVTRRAVYLFTFRKLPLSAGRMGQPVIGATWAQLALDPRVGALARSAVLTERPTIDGGVVVLAGLLGRQSFRYRLSSRAPAALAEAVSRIGT
jgi:hypothetical protein